MKTTVELDYNQGVALGNKTIYATGRGSFTVKDSQGVVKPINIDGRTVSALPLNMFDLSLEDEAIKQLPLNKFGYKEVATSEQETLVITANGLFIIYSGGLPSLVGLPTEHQVVSGVWLDETGDLHMPRVTLFSKAQNNINTLLCTLTSFRDIPMGVLNHTQWIKTLITKETDSTLVDADCCYYYEEHEFNSNFGHLYPRFTDSSLFNYMTYVTKLTVEGKLEQDSMKVGFNKFNLETLLNSNAY